MAKIRVIPLSVQNAKLAENYDTLSTLGRYGAQIKREMAITDRRMKEDLERKKKEEEDKKHSARRRWWSNSSRQMARQANEHICPID